MSIFIYKVRIVTELTSVPGNSQGLSCIILALSVPPVSLPGPPLGQIPCWDLGHRAEPDATVILQEFQASKEETRVHK